MDIEIERIKTRLNEKELKDLDYIINELNSISELSEQNKLEIIKKYAVASTSTKVVVTIMINDYKKSHNIESLKSLT